MTFRSNIRTRRLVGAAVVAVLALAACGTAQGGVGGPPEPSPAPTIHVGDGDNGRHLMVDVGTHIVVALDSTYWSFRPSSNPAVLAPDGSASASPSPGCIPGAGCGTVTQAFVVTEAGTAMLSAKRTTCGEALLCQPNQRLFKVTVTAN
jgi:hypothetical protein